MALVNDAPALVPGLRQLGNIDILHRPAVKNPDGSVSTVLSVSYGMPQGEVLIPRVVNGKVVSPEQALAHYRKTGQHLGIFDTPENATAYAQKLHQQQAQMVGFPLTRGLSGVA